MDEQLFQEKNNLLSEWLKEKREKYEILGEEIKHIEASLEIHNRTFGKWKAINKYPFKGGDIPNEVLIENVSFQVASDTLIRKSLQREKIEKITYFSSINLVEYMISGSVYGFLKLEE